MKLRFLANSKCLIATGIITIAGLSGNLYAQSPISSVTVTVNANATAPTSITSSAGNAFCDGLETTLTAIGGAVGTNGNYEWFDVDPASAGASPIADASGDTYTLVPAVGTHTFYVRTTGECGPSATAMLEITVHPTPVLNTNLASVAYCFGTTVSELILDGSPSGITFNVAGGADVGLADANEVTSIPSFTATNTTMAPLTRTISVTPNANGCAGTPASFDVTVMPEVLVATVEDSTICSGVLTTVPFASSQVEGVTASTNWIQTNFDSQLIGNQAETGSGDLTFTTLNTGIQDITGTFSVTTTITSGSTSCTSAEELFSITVRPQPNGNLATVSSVCEGQPVQLTFNATAGTGNFTLKIAHDGTTPWINYEDVETGVPFDINPVPAVGEHTYDLWYIEDAFGCVNQP